MRRRAIFALPALFAQEPEVDFICPMDRDVHAKAPGKCPRCGMRLVAGLPDPIEYPVELAVTPRRIKAAEPIRLQFRITDPRTAKPNPKLQLIHERLDAGRAPQVRWKQTPARSREGPSRMDRADLPHAT